MVPNQRADSSACLSLRSLRLNEARFNSLEADPDGGDLGAVIASSSRGLLSPALSSKGGEGEARAHSSGDAYKVRSSPTRPVAPVRFAGLPDESGVPVVVPGGARTPQGGSKVRPVEGRSGSAALKSEDRRPKPESRLHFSSLKS